MQIMPFNEVYGFDLALSNANQFITAWLEQRQILQITAHAFSSLSVLPTILIAVLKASYILCFFASSPSVIYKDNIKAVPKHTH